MKKKKSDHNCICLFEATQLVPVSMYIDVDLKSTCVLLILLLFFFLFSYRQIRVWLAHCLNLLFQRHTIIKKMERVAQDHLPVWSMAMHMLYDNNVELFFEDSIKKMV